MKRSQCVSCKIGIYNLHIQPVCKYVYEKGYSRYTTKKYFVTAFLSPPVAGSPPPPSGCYGAHLSFHVLCDGVYFVLHLARDAVELSVGVVDSFLQQPAGVRQLRAAADSSLVHRLHHGLQLTGDTVGEGGGGDVTSYRRNTANRRLGSI